MVKDNILEIRKDFYMFLPILWEMFKCLHDRELAFLSAKGVEPKRAYRFYWANSFDAMKSHFKFVSLDEILLNVYTSVAKLKMPLPIFTYKLAIRRIDSEYKEFNKNFKNYVKGYSAFFDMDGKTKVGEEYVVDMKKCYEESKRLKQIFDDYKLPYFIQPSSFSGFHFVIPAEYIDLDSIDNLLYKLNIVIQRVKSDYGFEMLDSGVIDSKRLMKCPYSISCDGCVILPLSDYEFNNYSPEKLTWEYVKKAIIVKNRGLLIRTHNLSESELKSNVTKFIYEHTN